MSQQAPASPVGARVRHVAVDALRLGRRGGQQVRDALRALLVDRRPHRYLRSAVSAAVIDRRKGLDTAGVVSRKNLNIQQAEMLPYEPSPWLSLRRILSPQDVGPNDVFLDIGSGKGRVLYEAARYPFRRVIGVEVSEELNEVARRNFARHQPRLQAPVEVHTADATTFDIPEDVTVVYLYNPVIGRLFESTIDNLIATVDAHPRPLRLICRALGPEEERTLEATGRFRLDKKALAPRPSLRWANRAALRRYVLEPSPAAPGRSGPARSPGRPRPLRSPSRPRPA